MSSHAFATTGDHCPFMPVFGPPQVMFVRGSGTELWDSNGKRYLDFLTGIAVCSLGHANPAVADATAASTPGTASRNRVMASVSPRTGCRPRVVPLSTESPGA